MIMSLCVKEKSNAKPITQVRNFPEQESVRDSAAWTQDAPCVSLNGIIEIINGTPRPESVQIDLRSRSYLLVLPQQLVPMLIAIPEIPRMSDSGHGLLIIKERCHAMSSLGRRGR